MHDAMVSHERQRKEHLTCEASDESSGEANETIRFDELIEVDTEEFHRNAQVVSEIKVFSHLDNVVLFF